MLNAQLTVPQWLSLPINTRMRLVKVFGIPRSQGSLVQDNKVMSDGYTHTDLMRISVESMQKFLDSDEKDFFKLLDDVIATLEAEEKMDAALQPQAPAWTLTEIPKDFTVNIGGKEYTLVEKTERLGMVKPEELKKLIGSDAPKAKRKYVKRGQRAGKRGR
jgi:hypothetical protein